MNILILGGTRFVGRAITEAALAAGHEITLFNRGRSQGDLFKAVETLIGDRDGGLDVLKNRRWDAAIDTSGYLPRLVKASAKCLADAVDQYTFISSISSYADFSQAGIDESTPQATLEESTIEEVNGDTYGPLKTHCEQALNAILPGRVLHVRPALIVGPYDGQELFPQWVDRAARGGEILVPGRAEARMQLIDARDLGRWVVQATEQKLIGPFITTGPAEPLTMADLQAACLEAAGVEAKLTYTGDQFLIDQGVDPNEEAPWWIPESHQGYGLFDNSKALAAGLTFRPLVETAKDTLIWLQDHPRETPWHSGFSAEKEQALLAQWHLQPA